MSYYKCVLKEYAPPEGEEENNMEYIEVEYGGGGSRMNPGVAVDYMIARYLDDDGEEVELYSEYPVGEDEDEKYFSLKEEIIEQAREKALDLDLLMFSYPDDLDLDEVE